MPHLAPLMWKLWEVAVSPVLLSCTFEARVGVLMTRGLSDIPVGLENCKNLVTSKAVPTMQVQVVGLLFGR